MTTREQLISYVCPYSKSKLEGIDLVQSGEGIKSGFLRNADGVQFRIHDGVPDFTWPATLQVSDEQTRDSYENMAEDYDRYASLPFVTYRCSEHDVRERMIDLLELRPDHRVLEIGCGTGRGAEHLIRRLSKQGELFLQEISPKLLNKAIKKLSSSEPSPMYSVANGSYLPFPDNFFDAAHHFGGINTFAEIERCLHELARVVRPGGKIVIGDEALGPWLRNTDFGRIMMNSNPLLRCEPPLSMLPQTATEVRLEYIMMGAFFTIDFRIQKPAPLPDYHMKIPSARGGSHWTRFYGQLEGISDEAKALAHAARKKSGKSMHDWLDEVVREAAAKQP